MPPSKKKDRKAPGSLSVRAQDHAVRWIPATSDLVTVNGLPWFEENGREFIRLPKRAEAVLNRDLWGCSLNTSGARVRFKTDSTSLRLRIHHGGGAISMHHFCARGCSGIDLYEGPPDKMTWWMNNEPAVIHAPYISQYFADLPQKLREFTLYLPTYCNIASLEIGIDRQARIAKPTPFKIAKPIVFYGSSITQGGCATRSAKGVVPVVGRQLNADIVNLGFSGLGRYEPEMAEFISEIDASCYVMACIANLNPQLAAERYAPFIEILRKRRPDSPILLTTRIRFAQENYSDQACWQGLTKAVLDTFAKRKARGDKNIYLLRVDKFIPMGSDHPSVDGVHLSDEGFKIMADAMIPVLTKILRRR